MFLWFVFKKKVFGTTKVAFDAGLLGSQLSKSQLCHCVSNCRTSMLHRGKTSSVLWELYCLQRLFAVCHSHFAYPNIQVKSLDFSEPSLHAAHWATRCYCLIDSSTGNTQELSASADKGIACLLWKEHPFNNGWNHAESFDPADHFTLLTSPLCSLTWLQLLIMYSI